MIVSVFGKSQYKTKACKAEMFSSVLQTDLLDGTIVGEDSLVKHYCFFFFVSFS